MELWGKSVSGSLQWAEAGWRLRASEKTPVGAHPSVWYTEPLSCTWMQDLNAREKPTAYISALKHSNILLNPWMIEFFTTLYFHVWRNAGYSKLCLKCQCTITWLHTSLVLERHSTAFTGKWDHQAPSQGRLCTVTPRDQKCIRFSKQWQLPACWLLLDIWIHLLQTHWS